MVCPSIGGATAAPQPARHLGIVELVRKQAEVTVSRTLSRSPPAPAKIGDIARAAVVLTHFEHGYIM